jgi:DNA-3-methyladenine glycosylase
VTEPDGSAALDVTASRTGGEPIRCGTAPLERGFFDRPPLEVAPSLLGCVLSHRTAAGVVAAEITEVEAYAGEADPASHAYRGRTARNAVMFGAGGHVYVYFTYGMHFCVNLVCGPESTAAAVLLRAGRVVEGAELAAVRRGCPPGSRDLARGPARLCQALGIGREQNGADACDAGSPLRMWAAREEIRAPISPGPQEARPAPISSRGPHEACPAPISRGPRVGVNAAGDWPWRFWVTGDPTVSVYRPHVPRSAR